MTLCCFPKTNASLSNRAQKSWCVDKCHVMTEYINFVKVTNCRSISNLNLKCCLSYGSSPFTEE